MGGGSNEPSLERGGDLGTIPLSPVPGSVVGFEDAGTFKPNTVIDDSNFEQLLRASGIDEAQIAAPGWLSAVKSAARIDRFGRMSALLVCDALKDAGSRNMAEKIRSVLGRELF